MLDGVPAALDTCQGQRARSRGRLPASLETGGIVVIVYSHRLLTVCALLVLAIVTLHLGLHLVPFDSWSLDRLRGLVDVDAERSLPTYLASVLLTGCALTALWLSRLEREPPPPGWAGVAVLFALAAVDEIATVHEALSRPVRSALDLDGWLRFAWVIPAGALLIVLALLFTRFLLSLPPELRRGLLLGAAVFIFGAMGLELPGGYLKENAGLDSTAYLLVSTTEETLEFAGTLLLLRALLRHLRDRPGEVVLRLR